MTRSTGLTSRSQKRFQPEKVLGTVATPFAAWTNHIGLSPPISGDKTLERAVTRYAGPKGNLQFPLNEPIPYDLIERIVKLRVKQDSAKAAAKRKTRK
jgi:uncharacterized protein YdhG (YjbR/CyaY superfamily)